MHNTERESETARKRPSGDTENPAEGAWESARKAKGTNNHAPTARCSRSADADPRDFAKAPAAESASSQRGKSSRQALRRGRLKGGCFERHAGPEATNALATRLRPIFRRSTVEDKALNSGGGACNCCLDWRWSRLSASWSFAAISLVGVSDRCEAPRGQGPTEVPPDSGSRSAEGDSMARKMRETFFAPILHEPPRGRKSQGS